MKARLLLTTGLSSLAVSLASAQLSEPDTVFFGKVLHHGGGEPHLAEYRAGTDPRRAATDVFPGNPAPKIVAATATATLATWKDADDA